MSSLNGWTDGAGPALILPTIASLPAVGQPDVEYRIAAFPGSSLSWDPAQSGYVGSLGVFASFAAFDAVSKTGLAFGVTAGDVSGNKYELTAYGWIYTTSPIENTNYGLSLAIVGDSIANGTGTPDGDMAFPNQTIVALSYPRSLYSKVSIGGATTAALYQYVLDLINAGYETIVLESGANDAAQSVSVATYASLITSLAVFAKSRSVNFYVMEPFPRTAAAASAIHVLLLGYRIWLYVAEQRLGISVVRTRELYDSTGYLGSIFAYDSTHPTAYGHQKIGRTLAEAISGAAQKKTLTPAKMSYYAMIADPLNLIGANAPSGSYVQVQIGSAPTTTIIADSANILSAGKWAQVDLAASADSTYMVVLPLTGTMATGDILCICSKIRVLDISGDWELRVANKTAKAMISLVANPVPKMVPHYFSPGIKQADGSYLLDIMWWAAKPADVLNGLAFFFVVPSGSHYTFQYAESNVFNLTELGVSGSSTFPDPSPRVT